MDKSNQDVVGFLFVACIGLPLVLVVAHPALKAISGCFFRLFGERAKQASDKSWDFWCKDRPKVRQEPDPLVKFLRWFFTDRTGGGR